jgi:ADP-ribose pyrophosphatase YjhB (NUDIX family)
VIERDEHVLLVRNRRRNGTHDWSPPGGVIDAGESVLGGLTREVTEETGLVVSSWSGPLYEIDVAAPDLGWHLRVEAWRALEYVGELTLADPDGIVVDARFVERGRCLTHLGDCSQWVREPLWDWIDQPWEGVRPYRYEIAGANRETMVVTRH